MDDQPRPNRSHLRKIQVVALKEDERRTVKARGE
jgi:hypothetical protein